MDEERYVVELVAVVQHSDGEAWREPLGLGLHILACDPATAERDAEDTATVEATAVPYDPARHGPWRGEPALSLLPDAARETAG